jgi:hypothetical protein
MRPLSLWLRRACVAPASSAFWISSLIMPGPSGYRARMFFSREVSGSCSPSAVGEQCNAQEWTADHSRARIKAVRALVGHWHCTLHIHSPQSGQTLRHRQQASCEACRSRTFRSRSLGRRLNQTDAFHVTDCLEENQGQCFPRMLRGPCHGIFPAFAFEAQCISLFRPSCSVRTAI